MRGAIERQEEIDALLTSHTQNWRIERMTVIDRLVLRMGVYEMLAEAETPSKVIINEAIELARSVQWRRGRRIREWRLGRCA